MGCSSSSIKEKENTNLPVIPKTTHNVLNLPREFKIESELFLEKHSKLSEIMNDPQVSFQKDFNMFKTAIREGLENESKRIYETYKSRLQSMNINENDLIELALDITAEEVLNEHFEIKEWDIHSIIKDISDDLCENINKESLRNFKLLLDSIHDQYNVDQLGLLYDIPSDNDEIILHMNKHLRINPKFYHNQMINFQFKSDNSFDNIYSDVANIIKCNLKLLTLVIFFKFVSIEANFQKFSNFSLIFDSIRLNSSLKTLVINFEENNNYKFPENVEKSFFEMLTHSSLIGIMIINFSFDLVNFEHLLSALQQNIKLIFICIHFKESAVEKVQGLSNSLKNNKSLKIVLISGGELEESHKKLMKTECLNIKVLEFVESIL